MTRAVISRLLVLLCAIMITMLKILARHLYKGFCLNCVPDALDSCENKVSVLFECSRASF